VVILCGLYIKKLQSILTIVLAPYESDSSCSPYSLIKKMHVVC
jgi:hypothetical protein